MQLSSLNKLLLTIEMVPIAFLLLLACLAFLASSLSFQLVLLAMSIVSLISLINIISKTISGNREAIDKRFVYFSHTGFIITVMGVVILLINGNGFKDHTPQIPYSAFSFGVLAIIPYFHVMIINNFFKK